MDTTQKWDLAKKGILKITDNREDIYDFRVLIPVLEVIALREMEIVAAHWYGVGKKYQCSFPICNFCEFYREMDASPRMFSIVYIGKATEYPFRENNFQFDKVVHGYLSKREHKYILCAAGQGKSLTCEVSLLGNNNGEIITPSRYSYFDDKENQKLHALICKEQFVK
ncbi:MAG: hypothetical protein WC688_07185 [Parachlamydiales bacterium]